MQNWHKNLELAAYFDLNCIFKTDIFAQDCISTQARPVPYRVKQLQFVYLLLQSTKTCNIPNIPQIKSPIEWVVDFMISIPTPTDSKIWN